ncbi:MAG: hypothetical protein AB8B65_17330 [Kordia sp.]|uniref:hypothetical protein n=1 Tax=Kordia sp. TaxID=1965332 RepID=UPI00385CCCB6
MKKTILFTIAFVSFFIVSCGTPFENDVKKLADLQCKLEKLEKKEKPAAEDLKLMKETETLAKKIVDKYTSDDDQMKLLEALEKAVKEMDCD